ncbi:MAG TPA: response regulator transcription factor [Anaerolineae bacterium]|jgi:two-component system KDP operon response regulator KdpE|nr:response regulator transcription factor [Anaerolineae bacterium]
MQNEKVLVVDDDPALLPLIEYTFAREGYQVSAASDGKEALRSFFADRPHLVILDIMMPRMDGWETCRRIREVSEVPIIMLTAKGQDEDIIRGLEYGADDYLTKPFSIKVLLARARAVLRRAALPPVERDKPVVYADDYLSVDLGERRVTVEGETVKLTPTEYRLLAYLVENAGQVLTFQQILQSVWGWEYQDDLDYVRVYVWHLRQKLERDPKNPRYVQTEMGVGYRFERRA